MTATTTKKPAAKKSSAKKPAPVPASESAPKHQIVDEVFIWNDDEQGDIRIPLRFKMKLLRRVNKMQESEEIDMLFELLDGLGDAHSQDQIDEMDVFDAMELVEAYFEAFQEKNKARLGESGRSSKS